MSTPLVVVRTFNATPERVFAAWTTTALVRQWMAPAPCVIVDASVDARVGGGYRVVVANPEGQVMVTTTGEYRELVPAKRIVKTWVAEGPNYPKPYHTLVTVDFREVEPGTTEVTIRQDQLLTEADRAGNREGWRLCLDRLDALLRS